MNIGLESYDNDIISMHDTIQAKRKAKEELQTPEVGSMDHLLTMLGWHNVRKALAEIKTDIPLTHR